MSKDNSCEIPKEDIEKVEKDLNNITVEWTERVKALQQLQEFCQRRLPSKEVYQIVKEYNLQSHLCLQLEDRRSSYLKEVCNTITVIAKCLGSHEETEQNYFDEFSGGILQSLTKLLVVTIKVMSQAAHECILSFLQYLGPSGHLAIIQNLSHTHPAARGRFSEYLSILLQKNVSPLSCELLLPALQLALQDSDATVRRYAKESFSLFQKKFPDEASHFLESQPPNVRKMLSQQTCLLEKGRSQVQSNRINFRDLVNNGGSKFTKEHHDNCLNSCNNVIVEQPGNSKTVIDDKKSKAATDDVKLESEEKENQTPLFNVAIVAEIPKSDIVTCQQETLNLTTTPMEEDRETKRPTVMKNKYAYLLEYEKGNTPIAKRLRSRTKK